MPRLTDLTLRNLPVPAIGQITYDDEGSPLKVRISQGGARTFLVMLGSGRRYTIGRFGEVTLAEAREAARRLRAERTLGRILPSTVSLDRARTEYLDEIGVRPSTLSYYRRNLNRLSGTKLSDISPRDIVSVLASRKPASRLQYLRTYTAFFNWCISKHYLEKSPCERMEAGRTRRRTRVLTADELRAIWAATAAPGSYNSIVRLCLATGQRKTEWAHCRDTWLTNYGVSFPPEICKNHNRHNFPLGPLARSLLPSCKGLLFPSDEGTVYTAWSKPKLALDKAIQIAPWQHRDLRRTYRTLLASLGTPREISERLVNHISDQNELEKIYDQFDYAEPMHKAQLAYEKHLASLPRILRQQDLQEPLRLFKLHAQNVVCRRGPHPSDDALVRTPLRSVQTHFLRDNQRLAQPARAQLPTRRRRTLRDGVSARWIPPDVCKQVLGMLE
jgi:hypothetical protein